jgi:hypothetical protein
MRNLSVWIAAAALSLMISFSADSAPRAAAGQASPRLAPAWVAERVQQRSYSALRAAPPAFAARYGGRWWERRGGPTGDFRRVFGEGVALDPAVADDAAVAIATVERFFADNADLLPAGVSPADLALRGTIAWRGKRIVTFDQEADGVKVEGAVAYAVIVGDRLVLWGVRLYPVRAVDGRVAVTAKAAEATARAALSGRRGTAEIASPPRHVLLPLVGEDALELRSAYAIPLRLDGRGKWTAFVDARSGELIDLRDERITMTGAIQLEHHDRNPGGGFTAGAGAYLDLVANGADVTTDAAGAFTAAGTTADVTGNLSGPYVDVQNMAGEDLALDAGVDDTGSYLWTSDGSEIEEAQLDAYVFALAVSDHARGLQDDVPWLDGTLAVRPNQPNFEGETGVAYCNAWSDGETINFLMAGDAGGGYLCNNAATVADVAYHEYGHCLHIQNEYLGAGVFDASASEAFADTMSVSMTHDHIIGPYFFVDGSGIRDVEQDLVYPDDYVDDPNYVHSNGLILGGALWDLRTLFVADLGAVDGNLLTDEIYVDMLRLTEDIPSSLEAALTADDDNGDLADGTPHACAIYDAFEPHGLAVGGLGKVVIDFAPIAAAEEPGVPIPLEADVTVPLEECATLGAVQVVYSVDQGATWTDLEMAPAGGDTFAAELPGMPEGSEIRYRIEAEEVESAQWITRPNNAAEPYYTLYVGPLAEILCDGFEGVDDGGWTHELLAGTAQEGADDWQRGAPTGKGGDPTGAFAGANAWGNDLGLLDNWNGMYQDGKTNTLRSPTYDLSAYGSVRLVFRRWLNVEDGYYDHARIYVNEQEVWTNYVSPGSDSDAHVTHHADEEWIPFGVDISALAGGQAAVQVRFEIESDQGLQFGGWTIDDFCLYTADDAYTEEPDAGADGGEPVADGGADAGAVPVKAFAMGGCGCDAAGAARADRSLLSAILASI